MTAIAQFQPPDSGEAMLLLQCAFTVWIVTKVLTEGYVMKGARHLFRELAWELLPRWMGKHFVKWWHGEDDEDQPVLEDEQEIDYSLGREIKGYSFLECALCTGFYVTMAVCLIAGLPLAHWLAVWGVAYFISTREG